MPVVRTYQNHPRLTEERRFLRQNGTTAEKILWKFLKNNQLGYKFRRQYGLLNFIVDFYCHQLKLVIELDGWTHNSEKTQTKDRTKQRALESHGYKIIRFTNEQIYGDIEVILKSISKESEARASELRL